MDLAKIGKFHELEMRIFKSSVKKGVSIQRDRISKIGIGGSKKDSRKGASCADSKKKNRKLSLSNYKTVIEIGPKSEHPIRPGMSVKYVAEWAQVGPDILINVCNKNGLSVSNSSYLFTNSDLIKIRDYLIKRMSVIDSKRHKQEDMDGKFLRRSPKISAKKNLTTFESIAKHGRSRPISVGKTK